MTIIRNFSHNGKHYVHTLDLSDDSVSLQGRDGRTLLHYDSSCRVTADGKYIGKISLKDDAWVFETADLKEKLVGKHFMSGSEAVLDTEVLVSKWWLVKHTPTLLGFLKSWLSWAEGGKTDDGPYDDCRGLCLNVRNYVDDVLDKADYSYIDDLLDKADYSFVSAQARDDICEELKTKLRKDHPGLSTTIGSAGCFTNSAADYPFNEGRAGLYSEECEKDSTHKNPARLEWVRKSIKELEDVKTDTGT